MRFADPEAARRFARWLSERLAVEVEVTGIATPGTGGGWSNETAIVDLAGGVDARVVVRLRPDGPAMFRTYDLAREYAILEALSEVGRPRVPKPIAIDPQGLVLGRPLFVMGFVAGRIPSDDRPGFAEAGWLFDASVEDQRRFHGGLVSAIADIHAVDRRHPRLPAAIRDADPSLRSEVDWLRDLHCWGAAAELHPTIERAFTWVLRHLPAASDACLLWGDARPANVVEAAFLPIALLDWELAGVGPAELDVAWFLEMNRMRTVGTGVPPLPGFLSDEQTVTHYEQAAGRSLADLTWYRRYAALKMAVLMERHLRVGIARGRLRPGHRLLSDNVALRRIEALLAEPA
jgi:aminoglycoside phosphotransferase (APT) family kinase protein